MDPQIEDEQMWRRNELNYIFAMITKYFSKVIVRFNPFGKEGMYFSSFCYSFSLPLAIMI